MNQSKNKYLSYVFDEHLLHCISNLYQSYLEAKKEFTKAKFYKNKVDTFKLTFDSKFNEISEKDLIKLEMARQIDKSVNNAIGTFHEEVLGGISGYNNGTLSGYDIKANDDSIFAEIKNKHNTMNSSSAESAFQKLARFADDNKQAKCYLVQILAKKSFVKKWEAIINGKEYSHSRVYMISGDKFYGLLTGDEAALFKLYKILPKAIDDFLKTIKSKSEKESTILSDISENAKKCNRNILDDITFENFCHYDGFDSLNR
ncbi:Eco47II family restriction endonuclease [Flavivirga amylovorans]|uniref:Eco47II family restriction endonuclease n=1 Tax=Flavivirga amylovorans TaxID=870486 RepID=A0ABT8WZU0_9FLAO|nr:Eco47II family restriction endonuclease [Flavivirga amylovorans]MDO5987185.1 Eco47II family restriction endonuclease [Flavivirga amylovorans]